jgi:hypothetical protein
LKDVRNGCAYPKNNENLAHKMECRRPPEKEIQKNADPGKHDEGPQCPQDRVVSALSKDLNDEYEKGYGYQVCNEGYDIRDCDIPAVDDGLYGLVLNESPDAVQKGEDAY